MLKVNVGSSTMKCLQVTTNVLSCCTSACASGGMPTHAQVLSSEDVTSEDAAMEHIVALEADEANSDDATKEQVDANEADEASSDDVTKGQVDANEFAAASSSDATTE